MKLNQILTAIDAGLGDGNFYTDTNSKTDRGAWEVVKRFAPEKSKAQCREVIRAWVETGLLEDFDYKNPKTRQPVKGLKVNDAKRPGSEL